MSAACRPVLPLPLAVLLTAWVGAGGARADRQPHAGMMRYPDVSATHIVFAYANDLWLVPREGGLAVPLASPPGGESFPRFSPDGATIAFVGNYDGNRDLYTIPAAGGVPVRVTHHPDAEVLCDWTPDGRLLFYARTYGGLTRQTQLYTVGAAGGMPEQLPVPYGANGAISPDGTWLAYTPHSIDHATWKRYRGGMATDIWLFNLRDHSARRITDWDGTDTQPMWHGGQVYYLADAGPNHRLNIWVYDTASGEREQITKFDRYDVKWPAIGPGPDGGGEIVFQNGAELYLLDLATRRSRPVEVVVPGDRPALRPQRTEVQNLIRAAGASATGARGVFEARGDIWTVPAQKGVPRNLTRTSGVAERDPAWSPDGRWVAYFSDETGEYELYVTRSDGKGAARRLTFDGRHYRYSPVWSPDSRHIAFTDKTGALYVHTLAEEPPAAGAATTAPAEEGGDEEQPEEAGASSAADAPAPEPGAARPPDAGQAPGAGQSQDAAPPTQPAATAPVPGTTRLVDTDPWAQRPQFSWSHDAGWIAYTRSGDNGQQAIWLYELASGARHQVTSTLFVSSWPAFDRKGDYLFFASNRHFADPIYEDIGQSFVYTDTDQLLLVPLRKDMASPWAPKVDEETWDDREPDKKRKEKKEREEQEPPASAPSETQPAESQPAETQPGEPPETQPGAAPPAEPEKPGQAGAQDAERAKKAKKPLRIDVEGFEARAVRVPVGPGAFTHLAWTHEGKLLYVRRSRGSAPAIKIFDLGDEEKKENTVLEGVGSFAPTADGKKILVNKGSTWAIVEARAGQNLNKPMPLAGMAAAIDPRAEWRQVFHEAWRLQRDFFYVANMHGVDWPAIREQYAAMLEDCVCRADVSYIIREMIAELNIGHAYYWGGEPDGEPSVSVGLLGVDFALEQGAYRIARILRGGPWDVDARGPLSQPGVRVREGDFLLAVDGVPLDPARDPWAAFVGLAGRTVTLTVSDRPVLEPPGAAAAARDRQEPAGKAPDREGPEGEDAAGKEDDAPDAKDEEEPEDAAEKGWTGQREVVVELLGDETHLRFRAWIERNRAYVDERTGGRVGYIYVPNTGIDGQNELFRQFYGQREKAGLIIDERWNGGGQVPSRFIELLNRPVTNYWARRDGRDWPQPHDAHFGPKCMLINGLAGSGGDAFPYYFRQAGLGKLIGMRTWGGLVGISGNPSLIDGAHVTVPTFGFYELDGTWGVEGHGVDPDIEVIDDPALMVGGRDPQLDRAIEHMLAEIERNPYIPPPRPRDPDRRGMGLPDKDR